MLGGCGPRNPRGMRLFPAVGVLPGNAPFCRNSRLCFAWFAGARSSRRRCVGRARQCCKMPFGGPILYRHSADLVGPPRGFPRPAGNCRGGFVRAGLGILPLFCIAFWVTPPSGGYAPCRARSCGLRPPGLRLRLCLAASPGWLRPRSMPPGGLRRCGLRFPACRGRFPRRFCLTPFCAPALLAAPGRGLPARPWLLPALPVWPSFFGPSCPGSCIVSRPGS